MVVESERVAAFGKVEDGLQTDPKWKVNLFFNEYFHGDNRPGLGACHQTGWTRLIADVIRRRHGAVPALGDILQEVMARKAEK